MGDMGNNNRNVAVTSQNTELVGPCNTSARISAQHFTSTSQPTEKITLTSTARLDERWTLGIGVTGGPLEMIFLVDILIDVNAW